MSTDTLNTDACPICARDDCDHTPEEQTEWRRREAAGEEQIALTHDQAQVAQKARTQKAKDRQTRADFAAIMKTPEGRRFMWSLLSRCGIWRSSFLTSRGDLAGMSFMEGERNIGLEIFARVTTETPAHYATMVKENGDK